MSSCSISEINLARNVHNEEQIRATAEGRILLKYLESNGLVKDIIKSYNDMLGELGAILAVPIYIKSDTQNLKVVLLNPNFTRPTYTDGNKARILYPEMAKKKHITYYSTISATPYMFKTDENGQEVLVPGQTHQSVDIMRLPVMVGSVLCNLNGINDPETLLSLGEDPKNPRGYVIINGNDRVIVNIEKMQISKIYVFNSKTGPYCRIISPTPSGTKLAQVIVGEGNSYNLQLSSFRKKDDGKTNNSINVIHIIQMLDVLYDIQGVGSPVTNDQGQPVFGNRIASMCNNHNSYLAANGMNSSMEYGIIHFFKHYIKQLVPEEHYHSVDSILVGTETAYAITSVDTAFGNLFMYLGISNLSHNEQKKRVQAIFDDQLFPDVDKRDIKTKIYMICMMVARLALYNLGVYPADDKDSWSNKKIESPGKTIAMEFRGLIRNAINSAQQDTTSKNYTNIKDIVNAIRFEKILDGLANAMVTSNHGVRNTFARQCMTDASEASGMIDYLSLLTKIDVPIDRNVKTFSIRAVQPSQLGYVCPAQTSDGSACGIVKNKALTAVISSDTESATIFGSISSLVSADLQQDKKDHLSINGIFKGFCNALDVRNKVIELRRSSLINKQTSVVYTGRNYIEISTNAGRLLRPLMVLNPDGTMVLDTLGLRNSDWNTILNSGAAEMIAAEEAEHVTIAQTPQSIVDWRLEIEKTKAQIARLEAMDTTNPQVLEDLNKKKASLAVISKPFDYIEMHAIAIAGISVSLIPFVNFIQSCRVSYQAKMFRQVMTTKHINPFRHDGTSRQTANPSRSIVRTIIDDAVGLNNAPATTNVRVALTDDPYNQEDSCVFRRGAIDNGMFRYIKSVIYDTRLVTTSNFSQQLGKPVLKDGESSKVYKYINKNGLPSIGAVLKEGDCIIGKVQTNNGESKTVNVSEFVRTDDYGVVRDVKVVVDSKGVYVSVKLVSHRRPNIGDKFAPRCAQKCTIGYIRDDQDMPFDEEGNPVDLLMNPHCIPSRMTMSLIRELVLGTAAAFDGTVYDATGFQGYDDRKFKETLIRNGYEPLGKRTFTRGDTGEIMSANLFVGFAGIQQLKHIADEKIQVRAKGRLDDTTRQATRGKKNDGAVRFGEMERKAALAHGAAYIVHVRLCLASDAYEVASCHKCGIMATYDGMKKKYYCRVCGDDGQYGKIVIPYVFKYLIQLMSSVGVNISSNMVLESEEIDNIEKLYEKSQRRINSEINDYSDDEESDDLDAVETPDEEYEVSMDNFDMEGY